MLQYDLCYALLGVYNSLTTTLTRVTTTTIVVSVAQQNHESVFLFTFCGRGWKFKWLGLCLDMLAGVGLGLVVLWCLLLNWPWMTHSEVKPNLDHGHQSHWKIYDISCSYLIRTVNTLGDPCWQTWLRSELAIYFVTSWPFVFVMASHQWLQTSSLRGLYIIVDKFKTWLILVYCVADISAPNIKYPI